MAETFKSNNWELAPVFRQLFKSTHFYEDRHINTCIKSPIETMAGLFRLSGVTSPDEINDDNIGYLNYIVSENGTGAFQSGGSGRLAGIPCLAQRKYPGFPMEFSASFLFGLFSNNEEIREKLRRLAIDLTEPDESDARRVTVGTDRPLPATRTRTGPLRNGAGVLQRRGARKLFRGRYLERAVCGNAIPDHQFALLPYATAGMATVLRKAILYDLQKL